MVEQDSNSPVSQQAASAAMWNLLEESQQAHGTVHAKDMR